jgi:hypothetical protein
LYQSRHSHRETLHKDLSDALDDLDLYETDYNQFFYAISDPLKSPPREEMEEETLRFALEFKIGYGKTSYKDSNQDTVSIKTLDIQCASRDAQFLKEIFRTIDSTKYYKTMLFTQEDSTMTQKRTRNTSIYTSTPCRIQHNLQ